MFPDDTKHVATVINTFHPDEEYILGYEAGCTEHSLRPGACLLWVEDGEVLYKRKDWTRWFAAKHRLSDISFPSPIGR